MQIILLNPTWRGCDVALTWTHIRVLNMYRSPVYRETKFSIPSNHRILYSLNFLLFIPCGTKIPSISYVQDAWQAVVRRIRITIIGRRGFGERAVHGIK